MKIIQNHCKSVLAQQPANNFDDKVEYCDLENEENSIHSNIKGKSILERHDPRKLTNFTRFWPI